MSLTHNQINRLWYRPAYNKFKEHGFVKQIFTPNDSEGFVRTGAYLIKMAEERSKTHIPWDEQRRYEILSNPRLENAFFSLGAEYLLKGVFLMCGYAINKPRSLPGRMVHPIKINGNKSKLVKNEVQDLSYIIDHIDKLIDFTEFDEAQVLDERKEVSEMKGQRLRGITRMSIPYPTAKQLLGYIRFKRNYALHRPFIIPEFNGTTRQMFKLLDFIAQKGTHRTIEKLAKLNEE